MLIANASHLPFGASVFDLVTSFETLEHLAERERFVTELRRVLTPDGLLVLSTPNANHTQPVHGRPRNPYHLHEYTPDELTRELALQFEQVELQGQTLHSRYKIPPFQDQQQKLSATPELLLQLFAWRVINKLPSALREWTSQTLWRRPFFPGETDYEFSPLTVDSAPVLVALCRPTRPIAPASGR